MYKVLLTNTINRKKEQLVPIKSDQISLYVCGVTPYDYAHIGHGRCYVTFDLLLRMLRLIGYQVTYVRNFTDIDDKIINRAARELGSPTAYGQIAERFSTYFTQDVERLGCLPPTYEPRVTQTIPEIIAFIQGLIEQRKAYVSNGDVYYVVREFKSYGALSGRNIDDLIAGSRVEVSDIKRDPLDFALWKSEDPGTYWESPWGAGRPGWHIECSAMAEKYLGKTIDIHGGGMDLTFPHHENERAQSEGLFEQPFVHYWIHVAFVRLNKEKMSKSLGNFFTLRQVFETYDPMVVRYYYAMHHYTIPLDFAFDDLDAATKTYERLVRIFEAIQPEPVRLDTETLHPIIIRMLDAMTDDLNTSSCMAAVFESLKEINADQRLAGQVKWLLEQLLGLTLQPLYKEVTQITPEIQALIDARSQARAAKDFKRADELRDQLKELGVDLKDMKL